MPEAATETTPQAETAAVGPVKRKLGIAGWVTAGWMIFLVLVALVAPAFTASPIEHNGVVEEGCGDGKGLPFYEPLKCSDTIALKQQTADQETNPRLKVILQRRIKGKASKFNHILGVDPGGRDVFSMLVIGTKTTLLIAALSILGATLLGGALGLSAGYFRGRVDSAVTLLMDVMIAFPPLVLAMLLVLTYAANDETRRVPGIILALAVVATPVLGRISRASTMSWSGREFVMAARALGAKPFRIITRDVLPNVAPAMMSIAMLGVGLVIVTESGLSIIGLGVGSGDVSWGSVVGAGAKDFRTYSHMIFYASVPILITVCSLNFLGDALRKKFDVRESAL